MPLQRKQSMGLQKMIFGTRSRLPEAGGSVEECKVHHLNSAGVWVTRPDLDGGKTVFGPLPYTWPVAETTGAASAGTAHTHSVPVPTNGPASGDRCLVVWAGPGVIDGWCLGWWPA